MTPSARVGFKFVVFAFAAVGLVYAMLFVLVSSARFRGWLQGELSERSGAQVHVAELRLLPPLRIRAEGLEISQAGRFLLKSRRLTATISPLDLFSRTVHRLDFEAPTLEIDISAISKSPDQTAGAVALRNLNVSDGVIVVKKSADVLFELPKIDLEARNFNLGEQAGMSLRADIPQIDGAVDLTLAGPLSGLQAEIVIRQATSRRLFGGPNTGDAHPGLLRLRASARLIDREGAVATIESKFTNFGMGDAKFTGALDGRVEVEREFTGADFTGRLALEDLPRAFSTVALKLPGGAVAASFSGQFAIPEKQLSASLTEISSPMGSGDATGEMVFVPQPKIIEAKMTWRDAPLSALRGLFPAPFSRWTYSGRGRLEAVVSGMWNALEARGIARGEEIRFGGAPFKAAAAQIAVPFHWSSSTLQIDGAKFVATGLNYAGANRWQLSAARAQATASSTVTTKEPIKISGRFETDGGKFSSPDSTKIGENLVLSGAFEVKPSPGSDSASVAGEIRVNAGEVLWDKFFNDLTTRRPELVFDADYSGKADRLDCRRCAFRLIDIGAVEVAGTVDRVSAAPELRLEARSADFSPGGFFDFFLRETYNRQYPLLDQLAFGGSVSFRSELHGTLDELSATGGLALKAGEIRVKSWDGRLGPIELNLPFQIRWPDADKRTLDPKRAGTLSVAGGRFGKQSIGPIKTVLSLAGNSLRFHEPIRISLFGGEISLGQLSWPDVIHDPKQLSFSLESKQLELQELTGALNWPSFGGTVTGSIPEVQSIGNTLKANGEIHAQLFGGRLHMNKLELENAFSSIASIKLDAELAGIQLEQLSQTFAFGRISGILEGTINDLVVTAGQPAQFRAELHSVDRGGEQRISVEALNKITVLSSGQSAGALYGGLAGFFDSFRYSKLGFRALLLNDELTLRGVETRGKEEYLVVGTFLPPTVNIVSHTQNIAFSELLRRLERIKSDQPQVK